MSRYTITYRRRDGKTGSTPPGCADERGHFHCWHGDMPVDVLALPGVPLHHPWPASHYATCCWCGCVCTATPSEFAHGPYLPEAE